MLDIDFTVVRAVTFQTRTLIDAAPHRSVREARALPVAIATYE